MIAKRSAFDVSHNADEFMLRDFDAGVGLDGGVQRVASGAGDESAGDVFHDTRLGDIIPLGKRCQTRSRL